MLQTVGSVTGPFLHYKCFSNDSSSFIGRNTNLSDAEKHLKHHTVSYSRVSPREILTLIRNMWRQGPTVASHWFTAS